MCIAIPGKIIKAGERQVEVEYPGVGMTRALSGGEKLVEGDYVMVQMGIVIRKVEKKEAKEMLKGWVKNG